MSRPLARQLSTKIEHIEAVSGLQAWWSRWTAPRPPLPRFSPAWWADNALIFTVFGVTGSSAVVVSRPVLQLVGVQGTWRDGPWSYRLAYIATMTPLYTVMLLTIGTLAGRHAFFKHVVQRMWGRLIPRRFRAS